MKKWYRRVRATCLAVLIFAICLRLVGIGSGASYHRQLKAASFLLYLQTGRVWHPPEDTEPTLSPTEAVPEETTVHTFPTTVPEPPLTFTARDTESLRVKYAGDCRPDLVRLLLAPVELDFSGTEPRILIVHTHATESYTQEPGWEYHDTGNYRTLDESHNMLRVGQAMTDILNGAGIPTIHDCTLHDYPSYNGSYTRSLDTIAGYLQRYPSIQMVIDVHRDAIEDSDGRQISTCSTVNGQSSAQIMLVLGTDQGGMHHPGWQDNLSWALKLQTHMETLYPGLPRALSLRNERFNQHATPGSILVEVGTAGDTLQAALRAAEAFANTLVSVIEGLDLGGEPVS